LSVPDTVHIVSDAPQPLATEIPAPTNQEYVSAPVPPEGVTANVAYCPLSIVAGSNAVSDGSGLTVTVTVPMVMLALSVTLTQYVVVEAGDTDTLEVPMKPPMHELPACQV
jgi:LysM repeat protein